MKTPINATGNPVQLTGSAVTYYTVPAATKSIIRHLHVANPSGSAVTFSLSNGLMSNAALRLYDAISIPAGSVLGGPGGVWMYGVMEVGMILQALAGTASVLVMSIDLDQYTLG